MELWAAGDLGARRSIRFFCDSWSFGLKRMADPKLIPPNPYSICGGACHISIGSAHPIKGRGGRQLCHYNFTFQSQSRARPILIPKSRLHHDHDGSHLCIVLGRSVLIVTGGVPTDDPESVIVSICEEAR